MKLTIDEKLKHRLVGVCVILSLGAIFLPAMLKKSSQHMEHNLNVHVKLPPKPEAPNVVMKDEDQLFKTIKVSDLDAAPIEKKLPATTDLTKEDFIAAAPLDEEQVEMKAEKPVELTLNDVTQEAVSAVKVTAKQAIKPATVLAKAKVVAKPAIVKAKLPVRKAPAVKQTMYAVQLASFSKLSNAQVLVKKLQAKGYKARYVRVGSVYKVYAGHSPIKNNVIKLKTQLASSMQLNGFVVNAGVS